MRMLIKNGRVIDPLSNQDDMMDVFITDGVVSNVSPVNTFLPTDDVEVVDASGKWVVPGLIDIHVHFREPGQEYKETISTGTAAAARGGFTTVCAMANTSPVVDNEFIVEFIKSKSKDLPINLLQAGSATKNLEGQELSSIGMMAKAGIAAISEDGKTVANPVLFRTALKYAASFNLPVLTHCEDMSLAGSGSIHAGKTAALLGLSGIPAIAEELIIARDIMLAEDVGTRIHIQHVSTSKGLRIIKEAKERGVNVTCEAAPHHFSLCEEDILDYDANFKVSPPLRSRQDMEAIRQGLADGTIDCIASDHAPHGIDDKNKEFGLAANGISGIETSLSLTMTELVHTGIITPLKMVKLMSLNPAKILGINKGSIKAGEPADITIIDPDVSYKIDVNDFLSKGKNSPVNGRTVKGLAVMTICGGRIAYNSKC